MSAPLINVSYTIRLPYTSNFSYNVLIFPRCHFHILSHLCSWKSQRVQGNASISRAILITLARARLSRNKMSSVSARAVSCHDAIYEILARVSVFKHGQSQLQRLQLQWPHTANIIQESSRRGRVVRSTVT